MYKRILPVLLLCGSSTAFAQVPTLTATNTAPVINDAFVTQLCDTAGVTQGTPGTSITWNFASLIPSTTLTPNKDTGTVATPSGKPGFSVLSLLSPAFAASTYATVTPSNTVTTYYQATPTAISQTGVYIDAGNNAVYSDPMDQLRFPFTYSNTYSDTYAGGLSYTPTVGGPVITATETGTVTVTADGYGTLVLPGTPAVTYNGVLRVHSSQNFRDSANLFGTPSVGTYDLESYTWYQPGYHSPLLTISTATGPGVNTKTVSYALKQIANHEAVSNLSGINASVNVYPNPASDYVYISYYNSTNKQVKTSLYDILGREVAVVADLTSQGLTQATYNVSTLAKGQYIIRLQSDNETISRSFTVK